MQTTKEVNSHPRIAPRVNMWIVIIIFFFFLCHLLNVGACIRHIALDDHVEWTTPNGSERRMRAVPDGRHRPRIASRDWGGPCQDLPDVRPDKGPKRVGVLIWRMLALVAASRGRCLEAGWQRACLAQVAVRAHRGAAKLATPSSHVCHNQQTNQGDRRFREPATGPSHPEVSAGHGKILCCRRPHVRVLWYMLATTPHVAGT